MSPCYKYYYKYILWTRQDHREGSSVQICKSAIPNYVLPTEWTKIYLSKGPPLFRVNTQASLPLSPFGQKNWLRHRYLAYMSLLLGFFPAAYLFPPVHLSSFN